MDYNEITVTITPDVLPEQYVRVPLECLLAKKIQRAIKQYTAKGWSLGDIRYNHNAAYVSFYQGKPQSAAV